jgi:hypothetical protein
MVDDLGSRFDGERWPLADDETHAPPRSNGTARGWRAAAR